MKYMAVIIAILFLSVTVLGFALLCHTMDDMGGDCTFASLYKSICQSEGLPMAIYHISAYQAFSHITLSSTYGSFMISVLLSLLAIVAFTPKALLINPVPGYVRVGSLSENGVWGDVISLRKKLSWLTLFENSPSVG